MSKRMFAMEHDIWGHVRIRLYENCVGRFGINLHKDSDCDVITITPEPSEDCLDFTINHPETAMALLAVIEQLLDWFAQGNKQLAELESIIETEGRNDA